MNTTLYDLSPTLSFRGSQKKTYDNELVAVYDRFVGGERFSWTDHQRLEKLLGQGGQGVVYLSERRGTDDFTLPIAVKIFSPSRYQTVTEYDEAMRRMAHIAARVAQIQHDNLLGVQNFTDRNRVRMMVMEWVDGFDLRFLLNNEFVERVKDRVSVRRWDYLNNVVITTGPHQPRFKPGVAVAIVRDCLGALAALHREGIVHGDVKPGNVMLKCTGSAKLVDIGSAFEVDDPPHNRACTPRYAAPEVLERSECTPRSDLASLGYILIEMLSGEPILDGHCTYAELLEAKRALPHLLDEILPEEVTVNKLLMSFCRGLIAPDPLRRFPSAEAADYVKGGAAAFHRQLVLTDLASEYDNDIRLWLEELRDLEDTDQEENDQE